MLIDWFTVGAQLLNFVVLIWLMKRFLYQPILNALDARERRISAELSDADAKKRAAQIEKDMFFLKNQEFEKQRAEFLKTAIAEAAVEKQQLLVAARQEAEQLKLKQQEALQNEQKNLISMISQRTQAEVFAIARHALQDLAGIELENHIVTVFIEKLQQLKDSEKQSLLKVAKNPITPLSVRTAFELSPIQQIKITKAVQSAFAVESELEFSTSPSLMCGIELSSDGQKIVWSVANYLVTLEKNLNTLLQANV